MKFLLTASMLHEGLNCDKLLLRCNILEGWACKWVRYHSIRSLLFRVNVTDDIWLIFHVCIRLCFWILLEGVGFLFGVCPRDTIQLKFTIIKILMC